MRTEEQRRKHREYMRRYYHESERNKQWRKQYLAKGKWRERYNRIKGTPEYKARVVAYSRTPKERARLNAYHRTEKWRVYQRKWRQTASGKAARRKYRSKQHVREYDRAYAKRYGKTVMGRIVARNHHHVRRARARITDISSRWLLWLRTATQNCIDCGSPLDSSCRQLDHIVPISRGGQHIRSNVRYICGECNLTRPRDASDAPLRTLQNGSRVAVFKILFA